MSAEKAARDAQTRADAIDAAVYDLKAVNPRETKSSDIRTPAQLLAAIKGKEAEVNAALDRLGELLAES